jgi:glycosyltransferase involved in cell wall biosynthesis
VTSIRETGSSSTAAAGKGRLLLVSTNMGLGGGAEEQIMQMAPLLARRGWTVEIVSMLQEGALAQELTDSGIPVSYLGMKRGFADPLSIFRLARHVRRFRPDVLHSHMTHANLLARAMRVLQPVPVLISTLHGLKMHSTHGGSTRAREFGHRLTDRWADVTTAVCRAAAENYVSEGSVPALKMTVVPNGIDTGRYAPSPADRAGARRELGLGGSFTWIAAGRFELPKNYAVMLRAFARLTQDGSPDSTLLICGSGSLEASSRDLAGQLGIAHRVRFLGHRRDIPRLMSAADAYVMSSDTEGLPLVLLQASSCALPIVATSVGGNPEVVQDGRTGLIVPPGRPESLAAAMQRIELLPAEERKAMGTAGRDFTRANYGIDAVIDKWECLYRQTLGRRSS